MIKIGNKVINYNYYNDGTFFGRINCEDYSPTDSITWLFDSEKEFLPFYFIIQHFRVKINGCHELNLPYVPSARMDRCENNEDIFTLKYMTQLINNCNFDKINIFDAHSRVSSALLNNVYNQSPTLLVSNLLTQLSANPIIVFCDEGGLERYRGAFNIPTVYGIKQRNWESQKIEQLVLCGATNNIEGKDALIVDDICGKGSTIYYMAKQLKERGANNIYVYVSHCENTVLQPMIHNKSLLDYDLINKIFTTNSIYRGNHPKIEVIYNF